MKSEIRNLKSDIGFTLVELLVVISIIALLLGILIVGVSKGRAAAEKAATDQYMGAISLAIQTYQNDFNTYPPSRGASITGSTQKTFGVTNDTMTAWEGSELLAQALVGLYTDDNHTGAGWAQSANSKVYGPYLDTGEYGILNSTIHTSAYVLADTWDQPIQYYRANYDKITGTLWNNRFVKADNNSKAPTPSPADDSTLGSAKYLLISIGNDGKVSNASECADNVVVTGP